MYKHVCKNCQREYFNKREYSIFCCAECKGLYRREQNFYIIGKDYAEMLIFSKGQKYKVLIDLEDVDICKIYKWHIRKSQQMMYVCANAHKGDKRNSIRLSRFLMNCPQELEVDHINRNTLDNRKNNLRCVNRITNARNKSFKENKNRNIYWNKKINKYQVSIRVNNKNISGGYFENLDIARIKAKEMRNQYFGEEQ